MEVCVSDVQIIARVERRRKWTLEEKAALVAEVEVEGGKVKLVARRHRVSESLLYNWRSALGGCEFRCSVNSLYYRQ
jgi:transposase